MFEYNTGRSEIRLKEYGRNVETIVNHIVAEPDREKRTGMVYTLVELIKQLNPSLREQSTVEITQKIWDDLYIISDHHLEVDSPMPPPQVKLLDKAPTKPAYNKNDIKYRHYGKNIELMIAKAIAMEDKEEQEALVTYIGRLMKTFFLTYNKDTVEDEVIVRHIEQLSKGKLKPDLEKIKAENGYGSVVKERRKPVSYVNGNVEGPQPGNILRPGAQERGRRGKPSNIPPRRRRGI